MKKVEGINISIEKLRLAKLGDLLFHEGPILSHFISDNSKEFFFFLRDLNNDFSRWLVFSISPNLLLDFFDKKINLQDLALNNPDGFVYFIDINQQVEFEKITLTIPSQIPQDYLPPSTSFFDKNNYHEYARQLESYTRNVSLRKEKSSEFKVKYINNNTSSIASEPNSPLIKKNKSDEDV